MKFPRMRVAYAAVLLLLLTAGCASVTPDTPVSQPQVVETPPATPPQVVATQPDTPPQVVAATPLPAATPVTPATPQPAPAAVPAPNRTTTAPPAPGKVTPPAARTPAPVARAPQPAAPPVVAPPVAAPPSPVTLDLKALTERLKDTKAIGIFTKLSLKNKVDDLLQQFREYYQGKAKVTLAELRQSYNLLMMKVLSLLQDDDQNLASAIVSSREAIWGLLADPKTFATLQI